MLPMTGAPGDRADGGGRPVCAGSPASFFRAVAVDFDGTLTEEGRTPEPAVLDAVAAVRAAGLRVILVTGRIIDELEVAWPGVLQWVDAVVGENGAVLRAPGWHRLLAEPVDAHLDAALASNGVDFRRGEVLLAAKVTEEASILGPIRALHLGCETVANRSELMVVPPGVSKGTGLCHALGHLGLSFHNTIAIGDAENDLSLFERSELGVAVKDAVESLKDRADLVLPEPDGTGIAAFLSGDVVRGRRTLHSSRWRLRLGVTQTGAVVSLPASQMNLLVAGGTGAGKSYVAGLLAEQLVEAGYSVLAIDPEGDHVGLGRMDGVLVVGGGGRLPDPDAVLALLHHRDASVVVDLSSLEPAARWGYQRTLLGGVELHRRQAGLPHWVCIDEADQMLGAMTAAASVMESAEKGYCLVTWRPEDLGTDAVEAFDAVVAVGTPSPSLAELVAAVGDVPRAAVAGAIGGRAESGLLVRRDRPRQLQPFAVADRVTTHLRHRHKYDHRPLDPEHGFHFRRSDVERTGAVACNLAEMEAELAGCDRSVVRHHCRGGDFSRWVAETFRDPSLARRLALVEATVDEQSGEPAVEGARMELLRALREKLVS